MLREDGAALTSSDVSMRHEHELAVIVAGVRYRLRGDALALQLSPEFGQRLPLPKPQPDQLLRHASAQQVALDEAQRLDGVGRHGDGDG